MKKTVNYDIQKYILFNELNDVNLYYVVLISEMKRYNELIVKYKGIVNVPDSEKIPCYRMILNQNTNIYEIDKSSEINKKIKEFRESEVDVPRNENY